MLAYEAMLAELDAGPKPGLVDPFDCGAHGDMDYAVFRRSADSIAPFFVRMEERARGREASPELFIELRTIGRIAEKVMFETTGSVNTHKGQIFLFALLIAAAADREQSSEEGSRDIKHLSAAVRYMSAGMVRRELTDELKRRSVRTHGEQLYVQYGSTGIRGEAEAGFPALFKTGLPVYSAALAEGLSFNEAAVECLLHLMCVCEDSTLLYRGGPEGLRRIRRMSRRVLESGGMRSPRGRAGIEWMNRRCIELNLSPGGSADLLAGTIFIYRLLYG